MLLELASSTQSKFFKNTVVAFCLDDGPIVRIRSSENEELTLVCLLQTLVQKCQQGESVEIRCPTNRLSQPFEEKWYDKWVQNDFVTKKKHPDDWRALKKRFDEKGIHRPVINRNDPATLARLKDAIHEERTGRKKQTPHVPRPGEPDENPWAKRDETLEEYLARKNNKD
jgi:hypothetical protein